jgi:hypothetical protein
MQRFIDFLTPLGLAVMVGAVEASRRGKLPGQLKYYVIAGVALMVLHLVLRFQDIVRTFGARQLLHGGNAVVMAVVVAVILGVGNYLVQRHDKSWDLSK